MVGWRPRRPSTLGPVIGRASPTKQFPLVRVPSVTAVAGLIALGPACGADGRQTVDVFAASSLVDIAELVEEDYEADNPETDIRLNLAGTNALIRQINSGADAAVLVAADTSFIDDLIDQPSVPPLVLATNRLTLVVPADNRAKISGPADLNRDDVLTARCAPGVPCGDATDRYLATSDLLVSRATEEPNVRAVLAKVTSGEVDAGFVYRSDALAGGTAVKEIPLAGAPEVAVAVARLDDSRAGAELIDHFASDDIRHALEQLGFAPADRTTGSGGDGQ